MTVRLPAATLLVVGACLAVAAWPGAAAALEHARAITPGEPWRLVTSQLVHWSPAMLVGDLLLLGIAGAVLERRSPRRARAALLFGALLVAAILPLTGLVRYRGSSGLGVAVLTAAALDLLRHARGIAARVVPVLALVLLGAKIAFEAVTGASTALTNLPEGVVAVPAVHLAGFVAGVLATVLVGRSAPSATVAAKASSGP